jgi:chromosome segregation protein
MYLEKLELQGFKSFANKNKLVFSGLLTNKKRGITVVVGPNGSGKSNIADSIRWALGEQSTKLLRSKKSEDVIFSGSDKKNRLNMAEVSLYFNNEQGILNSNINESINSEDNIQGNQEGDNIDALLLSPEIVLTRRIFRDGNSEYYINNLKVRLSDIQIFLAKANFGQKTYSVIGQGMVENFLNTTPAERKVFFDEATGVKQYQIKRDLSLNKLESSQENLSKVEMLLNEIEPRLKSLTRQVNKLKKRQFLEEELLKNQLNYYNKIWKEINYRLNEFQGNIDKCEHNKSNLERNIEEKKTKLEIINQGETIGEEFYELQKRFLFLKGEQDRAIKQIEKISLYHQTKKENDKVIDNDLLNSLNLDKNNLIKEIEEINKRSEESKNNSFNQEELKNLEEELNILERKNNDDRQKLLKIEAWLEVKFEKQGKFDLSFLINRETEVRVAIGEIKNNINTILNSIKKTEDKIENLQTLKNETDKQLVDLNKELDKIITNSGLFDSNKINQGLEKLIDKIEKNKDLEDFSLFKKIIDEIKDEIKSLLKISSGEDYNFKIKSFNKKITELKEEIKNIDDNIMTEYIKCNSEKNKKSNLEENLRKLEQELKSVEEKIKQNKNIDQIDDNSEKKEEIENEIKNNEAKIIELQNKIFSLRTDRDDKQEQKFKIQEELQKKQNKLNEVNNNINSLKSDSIKIQSRLEDLEQEIKNNIFSNIESEIFEEFIIKEKKFVENFQTENDKEIAILQSKIDNFNQEQENKKRELIELQRDIKELELEMENLNNSLNDNRINLTREETRIEELQNNIENDKLNLEKIKKHDCLENFDTNIVREEIGRLKNQLELIGGIDPETEKEYEETKKRFDFLFDQTEDLNKTIKSLEKVIIELDALIKEKFESEFKVISEKFNEYFKILFNGGNAKIFPVKDEIDNEDKEVEDKDQIIKNDQSIKNIKLIKRLKKYNAVGLSGVDISATPPGKKISSVNMLSGGERALTAIALICAIISANPSPFVVLDEVDASLDESNSERLAKILDDLSNKTQFIAISHNRATMKKANILYGVTMQRDGISKLLSVKLDEYK